MNNKPILLWLDDTRDPFDTKLNWVEDTIPFEVDRSAIEIVWIKDYYQFESFLRSATTNGQWPATICFDHDLGDGPDGMECVRLLIDICQDTGLPLPAYFSQSSNYPGRVRMLSLLKQFQKYNDSNHEQITFQ